MSRRRDSMLREMGLAPLWKLRAPAIAIEATGTVGQVGASADPPGQADRAAAIAAMDWDELRASVAGCRACEL